MNTKSITTFSELLNELENNSINNKSAALLIEKACGIFTTSDEWQTKTQMIDALVHVWKKTPSGAELPLFLKP